jgi:MYXO-CTERM domain-containing protein
MSAKTSLAATATTLALLTMTASAWAAGNFSIKTTSVAESSGEWHIKVRIDLPRAPGMMHIPMRFTFSKEAVDERAIMSKGADPVHHRMVLDTPPKQIQSLDVDFADASGKVFKSTYYEFDLQRATGYFEAGEYLVSLSGPDGDVGTAQKLTLTGDNPPVYRGAMDFGGDTGKKKSSIQSVSSGLEGGAPSPGGGSGDDDSSSAAPASTDVAPVGNGGSMVPSGAFNKTDEEEAVKGHPSGCGCALVGVDAEQAFGAGAATFGLGLFFAVRRRSRRAVG